MFLFSELPFSFFLDCSFLFLFGFISFSFSFCIFIFTFIFSLSLFHISFHIFSDALYLNVLFFVSVCVSHWMQVFLLYRSGLLFCRVSSMGSSLLMILILKFLSFTCL